MHVMRHLPMSGLSLPLPPNIHHGKIIIMRGPVKAIRLPSVREIRPPKSEPPKENNVPVVSPPKTEPQKENNAPEVNRPVNSMKLYCCSLCMKGFYEECDLKMHVEGHSKAKKSLVCRLCCNGFIMESVYEKHLKIHKRKKPYVCNWCRKSYSQSWMLSNHRLKHRDRKPFRCTVCSLGFLSTDQLETHLQYDLNRGDLCNICERVFFRDFDNHFCGYSGDKPKICGICEQIYFCLTSYNNHVQTHSKEGLQLLTNAQNKLTE